MHVHIDSICEGRKESRPVACDYLPATSAIHSEILSQVDCVVAHRLTVQSDIDAVKRSAKGRSPEKISSGTQALSLHDLLRELAQGQAYISHGDTTRAFMTEIRPRVTAHGGIEG